jgi:hypothetical protein
MMRQLFLLFLIAMTASLSALGQKRVAIVNVTVIDGTDHPARKNATVIVQGKKIETIPTAMRRHLFCRWFPMESQPFAIWVRLWTTL